jgi:hypothetical protein
LELRILDGVRAVDAAAWDRLVGEGSPFLEHAFLATLEEAGCVGDGTGWRPCPVTAWRDGRLVGAAPAYVKGHSYGEFVYDWQWAGFAKQNGIRYYPKVVVAVPFTPVAGDRLLVEPGPEAAAVRTALIQALREIGARGGGLHVLFPSERDTTALEAAGAMIRLQWQYHWHNQGFTTFEDFLTTLPSKRRTAIRKERKEVAGFRIEAGEHPDPGQGALMWSLYQDTHQRHSGGDGYLNPRFFDLLFQRWGHRLHTVVAYDGATPIAGTLNVRKGDRLYGRHWGTLRDVPYLHFEVAIYRAVEWCITHRIAVFEPGHGGEHKRSRGFAPTLTTSAHWLTHPGLDDALRDFCRREAEAVRATLGE